MTSDLFVSEDRTRVVDELVDAFDRVARGGGPELTCLVAPIAAMSVVAGLLGVFVPPVGWAATVHDSVKQLWETGRVVAEGRRRRRRARSDRDTDAEEADRRALVRELAAWLVALSSAPFDLPTVVVLDDAHEAAESAIALVDRLLASPTAKVASSARRHSCRGKILLSQRNGFRPPDVNSASRRRPVDRRPPATAPEMRLASRCTSSVGRFDDRSTLEQQRMTSQ